MATSDADRYPAEVFWSDEDEGFIALAPDLPGCSAWGDTEADALRELRDAIVAWIEGARMIGKEIPHPAAPKKPTDYSGKFVVRLPQTLHAEVARRAEREGVSLNQWVVCLLSGGSVRSSDGHIENSPNVIRQKAVIVQ